MVTYSSGQEAHRVELEAREAGLRLRGKSGMTRGIWSRTGLQEAQTEEECRTLGKDGTSARTKDQKRV